MENTTTTPPKSQERQQEALHRARGGQSLANYPAIFQGFLAKGIPEQDIRPRENVLTFHAWKALGRVVRKGEKGVKVTTWIPIDKMQTDEDGMEIVTTSRRPKTAVVFHVSQTKSLEG